MPSVQERARLLSLRQLRLLDTPASDSFDRITRTASLVFGLPYAAISLTDHDRQWFKSRVGIDAAWMARKEAPCSRIAETTASAVIADLAAHEGFKNGELVRSGMRFYAGAPLVTRDGHGLGALCVLGPDPRLATEAEMGALRDLAAMVMAQVELEHAFGRIDPTSGLPNRAQLADDLLDLSRNDPGGARIAVLVDLADTAQLDNFARVMGYSHVDAMVKYAAGVIRESIGGTRTAYHVSPTQIAFLAPVGADFDEYVRSVTAGLIQSRATSDFRFAATTVVGVAPFRLGAWEAGDLLRALHSAAKDARDTGQLVSIYSAAHDDKHRRHFQLLQDSARPSSIPASCAWFSSRASISPAAAASARRRCCAGRIRPSATSRPESSSRSSNIRRMRAP